MDLQINKNKPMVMHIDLNSAFASVEQQSHPHLRNKNVVVAAYAQNNACIVAPSINAKRHGVKTGMKVREARIICPDIFVITPDPNKYRDFHTRFKKIVSDYSPDVTPKSIDEVVINFAPMESLKPDLIRIGKEIKTRIKDEIGDFLTVNVGIGTNRFLAKTAASLHKPDGLDVISHENLLDVLSSLELIDLNGINTRFQVRLNAEGIYSPMDFFNANVELLKKQVFHSILGYYWFLRLRGYEIDDYISPTQSIGQDYSIRIPTTNKSELGSLFMKLCEKMGRRLRRQGYTASGVHISLIYDDWTWWHQGKKFDSEMYTTQELYRKIMLLFNHQPEFKPVAKIGVACYSLTKNANTQIGLFGEDKGKIVQDALDQVNDKYGEFTVTPGSMIGMNELILDRIAFGGVKEMQDLYN